MRSNSRRRAASGARGGTVDSEGTPSHPRETALKTASAKSEFSEPAPSEINTALSDAVRVQGEAVRLILQAQTYDALTRRFFIEAGIRKGMRVIDVGSGPGDVSLLVSELVGSTGSVLGIERSVAMVAIATERARLADKNNVSFVCADAESMDLTDGFDALVGRFVLRELRDAAQSLRNLARFLVPHAVVAFQEKVLAIPIASFPRLDLVENVRTWMDEARRKAGVEISTGIRLPRIYEDAGLSLPHVRLDTPVGYGDSWPGYDYLAETLRGMMPLIHLYGIASEPEIDIESLASRMRDEAVAHRSMVTLTPCMGAWTTWQATPGGDAQ
jgi:ubiquinone/menaquinone biosynthesis C-methylase UbiE